MTRRASAEDIAEICLGLPEVESGTSWGDTDAWAAKAPKTLARKYLEDV